MTTVMTILSVGTLAFAIKEIRSYFKEIAE